MTVIKYTLVKHSCKMIKKLSKSTAISNPVSWN